MNQWFHTQAGQQQRRNSVRTHVGLITRDAEIAAFYSLAAHRIELDSTAASTQFTTRKYPIPALLIARLAVEKKHQGRGFGRLALGDALRRCLSVSSHVGVEVVLVDAIDASAADFYAHHGFQQLTSDGRRHFITMRQLERSMRQPRMSDDD